MPAIHQTKYTTDGKTVPPVTHRAILKPRGPAEEIRRAAILTPLDQLCARAPKSPGVTAEGLQALAKLPPPKAPDCTPIKTERIPNG